MHRRSFSSNLATSRHAVGVSNPLKISRHLMFSVMKANCKLSLPKSHLVCSHHVFFSSRFVVLPPPLSMRIAYHTSSSAIRDLNALSLNPISIDVQCAAPNDTNMCPSERSLHQTMFADTSRAAPTRDSSALQQHSTALRRPAHCESGARD
jgi:hypothetical protein